MGSLFGYLGSFLAGPLSAITGQIAGVFTNAQNVKATEFAAMTAEDQAATLAYLQAQTALNSAKVSNNAHGAAYFFVWIFGLGPAAHWSAVFIATTFPQLGWVIPALPAVYADAELKIALSFFVLAPALPVLSGLASRLKG